MSRAGLRRPRGNRAPAARPARTHATCWRACSRPRPASGTRTTSCDEAGLHPQRVVGLHLLAGSSARLPSHGSTGSSMTPYATRSPGSASPSPFATCSPGPGLDASPRRHRLVYLIDGDDLHRPPGPTPLRVARPHTDSPMSSYRGGEPHPQTVNDAADRSDACVGAGGLRTGVRPVPTVGGRGIPQSASPGAACFGGGGSCRTTNTRSSISNAPWLTCWTQSGTRSVSTTTKRAHGSPASTECYAWQVLGHLRDGDTQAQLMSVLVDIKARMMQLPPGPEDARAAHALIEWYRAGSD